MNAKKDFASNVVRPQSASLSSISYIITFFKAVYNHKNLSVYYVMVKTKQNILSDRIKRSGRIYFTLILIFQKFSGHDSELRKALAAFCTAFEASSAVISGDVKYFTASSLTAL